MATSDRFGTTWESTPHTKAKHEILRQYWNRWLPILGRWNRGLNYIDGFAGPGEYAGGELGSPVIVLKAALEHKLRPAGSVSFTFIERQADRAAHLRQLLAARFPVAELPAGWEYSVDEGEFAPIVNRAIDEIERKGNRLAPTLAFLDPFGFSGFPLPTVRRILSTPRCEVLVTFMAGHLRRFLDELRADTLNDLFDSEDWRAAASLTGEARVRFLLDLYEKQLKARAGAKFVRSFEMCGVDGGVVYYLVFATTHPEGLKQIKEAMFAVDRRGTYRFSDLTDPGQRYLLDYLVDQNPVWVDRAANMVFSKFRGRLVSASTAKEFVWLETPYVWRLPVFKTLEDDGRIASVRGRGRGGGFGDACELNFRL